jgi:hypothetical protein
LVRERRTERNRRRRDRIRETKWELSEAKRDPDAFRDRELATRTAALAGGPLGTFPAVHTTLHAATPPTAPADAGEAPPDGMTRVAESAVASTAETEETDTAGLTDAGQTQPPEATQEIPDTEPPRMEKEPSTEGRDPPDRVLRPRNLAGTVAHPPGRGTGGGGGVFHRGGGRK